MRFEHWVFEEVLPSIMTTGSYGNHMAPMAIGAIVKEIITEQLAEKAEVIVAHPRGFYGFG